MGRPSTGATSSNHLKALNVRTTKQVRSRCIPSGTFENLPSLITCKTCVNLIRGKIQPKWTLRSGFHKEWNYGWNSCGCDEVEIWLHKPLRATWQAQVRNWLFRLTSLWTIPICHSEKTCRELPILQKNCFCPAARRAAGGWVEFSIGFWRQVAAAVQRGQQWRRAKWLPCLGNVAWSRSTPGFDSKHQTPASLMYLCKFLPYHSILQILKNKSSLCSCHY